MSRGLLFLFLSVFSVTSYTYSGISVTTKHSEKKTIEERYDGKINFLGDKPHLYIGEKLYLKGKPENLRRNGYTYFYIKPKTISDSTKDVTYLCCQNETFGSKYDKMVGRYFKVIDVHEEKYNKYYLELEAIDNGDRVYYEYSPKFKFEFNQNFIVNKYFDYLKNEYVGEKYVFRGTNWNNFESDTISDFNTGEDVKTSVGSIWTIKDITIENKHYNLVFLFENESGDVVDYSIDQSFADFKSNRWMYSLEAHKKYIKRFGEETWKDILGKTVRIGFTEEMVRLALGDPKSINYSSSGDQWVYSLYGYIYFENGKVTAWN